LRIEKARCHIQAAGFFVAGGFEVAIFSVSYYDTETVKSTIPARQRRRAMRQKHGAYCHPAASHNRKAGRVRLRTPMGQAS